MQKKFEPLASGEVLSVSQSAQILIGHNTFRVGELAEALRSQLLEYGIGGITGDRESWFSEEGVDCEVLKFGSLNWQKGRVRLYLEFSPSEDSSPQPAPPQAVVSPPPIVIPTPQPAPPQAVVSPPPIVTPTPTPSIVEPEDELESEGSFTPIPVDDSEDLLGDIGENFSEEAISTDDFLTDVSLKEEAPISPDDFLSGENSEEDDTPVSTDDFLADVSLKEEAPISPDDFLSGESLEEDDTPVSTDDFLSGESLEEEPVSTDDFLSGESLEEEPVSTDDFLADVSLKEDDILNTDDFLAETSSGKSLEPEPDLSNFPEEETEEFLASEDLTPEETVDEDLVEDVFADAPVALEDEEFEDVFVGSHQSSFEEFDPDGLGEDIFGDDSNSSRFESAELDLAEGEGLFSEISLAEEPLTEDIFSQTPEAELGDVFNMEEELESDPDLGDAPDADLQLDESSSVSAGGLFDDDELDWNTPDDEELSLDDAFGDNFNSSSEKESVFDDIWQDIDELSE